MLTVRPMEQGDLPLIYTSWLSTFKNSRAHGLLSDKALAPYAKLLEPERASPSLYFALHKLRIANTLAKSTTLVAAYENDPALIVGWVCFSTGVLHYVCVKQDYQGEGIAKLLVEHSGLSGNVNCDCVPDDINVTKLGTAFGLTLRRV